MEIRVMETQMKGGRKRLVVRTGVQMLSTGCVYLPGSQWMEARASDAQRILGAELRLHIFANAP